MLLTNDQRFLLDILREVRYMRLDQILPLMRLRDPAKAKSHCEAILRYLRYAGELVPVGDDLVCLAEFRGQEADPEMLCALDILLSLAVSQKDLTYIATPDLRTRYHPGQTLNCVLKEYDRREGQFWVSVKDTVDNPFFGALRRHPIGSRRQAVISGKYGGGVFCTLSDETVCLCHYSTLHSDLDFHVGDTVILAIKQFDYERSLIYGRILSKW